MCEMWFCAMRSFGLGLVWVIIQLPILHITQLQVLIKHASKALSIDSSLVAAVLLFIKRDRFIKVHLIIFLCLKYYNIHKQISKSTFAFIHRQLSKEKREIEFHQTGVIKRFWYSIMNSLQWLVAFILSDTIQLVLVTPRMLSSSSTTMNKVITLSYVLAVLGDMHWHNEHENNAMAINIASVLYLIGTLPFVYNFFFRGCADRGLKFGMAALYGLWVVCLSDLLHLLYFVILKLKCHSNSSQTTWRNIFTFGDPNDTGAPMFYEKHLANHLGSTLFYYMTTNSLYQTKEESKKT